jgi:SHS2 domain-containing protein
MRNSLKPGRAGCKRPEVPMGTVTTFDHTADVGLTIVGNSLDDLFETAAQGLFDYIVSNRNAVRDRESEAVALRAEFAADLLVAWLNELVFRSETTHRLYSRFTVHVADDGLSLSAEIAGEPIDRKRHVLDHEVKAVTQHGLSLAREGAGWKAEVILDI